MNALLSWRADKIRSLTKKNEFQRVYENGVKKVGRFVVVYLLCADDSARAFVASRKVGGAVQRNRGKRLMREAFRNGSLGIDDGMISIRERFFPHLTGEEFSGKKSAGLWVVLVARHRILKASDIEVRQELDDLLSSNDNQ
jgi:ribonuclease P protein component